MSLSRLINPAGSMTGVISSAESTAKSIGLSNAYMEMMRAESQDGMKKATETALLSKELSQVQALGKFFKATGDAVKSMAP